MAEAPAVAAEPLIAAHRRHFPKADVDVLRRGFEVAAFAHRDQKRKSGAPYVTHPLAVALLLAELGMDTTTLVAALLHDTVEDTSLGLNQVRDEFGAEVAVLVDGVTKLDGSKWGDRAEAETFRKMILAAADDLRVILIKLADRVHNLRTLHWHPKPEKRERIARQSVQLLVPLAERLGVYVLRREMEDLAFANLRPEAYEEIRASLKETERDRAARLGPLVDQVTHALRSAGLKAQVETRNRHLYSIHRDRRANPILDQTIRVGDATRITILVNGPDADCYLALGAVHAIWHPMPARMKDFIAAPKHNLYQSLHTTVVTADEDVLEVEIRTPRMHRLAEFGIIVHINDAAQTSTRLVRDAARRPDLDWLRNLLAWQAHPDSGQYLDSIRAELRSGSIVVFTETGDVVPLPRNSTPIDFAYAVDPELGAHAIGAMVNDRLAGLHTALDDGQVVRILTSDSTTQGGPSEVWLETAQTGNARVHIQRWLDEQRADRAAVDGRLRLVKVLAENETDLLELEQHGVALAVCRRLGYPDLEALYAAVANETVVTAELAEQLVATPAAAPVYGQE
ncbi:hypothetical protein GCM10009765_83700 [Fodinicola feengrottensis]|uniref:Bifunctional (P)ppGpp synthetase/guanosine-3',5'-bis(Diphosphate) 3'-pyrophosphohydrolase n=1 Tax=Fodinicola feengrottensis TaxID=435914 RepID=A0ABN2JD57_9ACTN